MTPSPNTEETKIRKMSDEKLIETLVCLSGRAAVLHQACETKEYKNIMIESCPVKQELIERLSRKFPNLSTPNINHVTEQENL